VKGGSHHAIIWLPHQSPHRRCSGCGEDVLISGFGKFCVKNKKKRKGRNPATGKDLILAPRKVVIFKWSGKLKEKLNPKPATKTKKRRVRG
jgi:hypothetical protein